MEIAVAPQSPHITRAASENGATEWTSCSRGTNPITAIVPSTYAVDFATNGVRLHQAFIVGPQ